MADADVRVLLELGASETEVRAFEKVLRKFNPRQTSFIVSKLRILLGMERELGKEADHILRCASFMLQENDFPHVEKTLEKWIDRREKELGTLSKV
mgnify:CR=1 FL=1